MYGRTGQWSVFRSGAWPTFVDLQAVCRKNRMSLVTAATRQWPDCCSQCPVLLGDVECLFMTGSTVYFIIVCCLGSGLCIESRNGSVRPLYGPLLRRHCHWTTQSVHRKRNGARGGNPASLIGDLECSIEEKTDAKSSV